jgi:predicted N-acetyltransferase YhbS
MQSVELREARSEDAESCGRIIFEAFGTPRRDTAFPPDFPSVEAAMGVANALISHPRFLGSVAESEGRIVGSNFLDERSVIAGIGPITIDPAVQDHQIGRRLMVRESASYKPVGEDDRRGGRPLCPACSGGYLGCAPICLRRVIESK